MSKKGIFLLYLFISISLYSKTEIGKSYLTNLENFSNSTGIIKTENTYIISDYIKGKILIYDDNFNQKKKFENFNSPAYMYLLENKIFISEHGTNTVSIIDIRKNTVIKFGNYGKKEKEFNHPGVIFSYNENIHIIDEYNHRIQVLNNKMEFLYEILLPKFDYLYIPNYKLNYKVITCDEFFYILDCYSRKIYKCIDSKMEIFKDIYYIKDPIDFFIEENEIFVLDNYDFSINNIKKPSISEQSLKKENKTIILKEKKPDIIKIKQLSYNKGNIVFLYENFVYEYNISKDELKTLKELKKINKGEFGKPISIIENSKKEILILDNELNKIIIYNKHHKVIDEKKDIGKNPTDFYVDEFDNYYVCFSGENKIKKYNKNWKVLYEYGNYNDFKSNYLEYYNSLNEENRESIKLLDKNIYHLGITLDRLGNLYIIDSKAMSGYKYNPFFYKQFNFGVKASTIDVLRKNFIGKFSWDEENLDNLKDIFYFKDKIYILDSNDTKVLVYNTNGIYEKEYKFSELDSKKNSLKSIYIKNNRIYLADYLNFKIKIYDLNFEKINEISFLKEGLMPIHIYENYVIFINTDKIYENYYVIWNIGDILNDKNK